MGFIVGIRTETRNYRELSSIYGHFPKIKPHKQGRIENYQEFWHEDVGVRCNLDTLNCPPKKRISLFGIEALYTKIPRKSSCITVALYLSIWKKPFCISQYLLDCLKGYICFSFETSFWFYPQVHSDYLPKPHNTIFRSFYISAL